MNSILNVASTRFSIASSADVILIIKYENKINTQINNVNDLPRCIKPNPFKDKTYAPYKNFLTKIYETTKNTFVISNMLSNVYNWWNCI
jgi:hypothetical protein